MTDNAKSKEGKASHYDCEHLASILLGKELKKRYKILNVLGKGGWGVVFKAERIFPGTEFEGVESQFVALKVLHPELHVDEKAKAKFNEEIKLMIQARHPHLASAVEVLEIPVEGQNSKAIIMPYADSGDMRMWLRRRALLRKWIMPVHAFAILRGLLDALKYLHTVCKKVHSDIKAENILVFEDYHVRLSDFGLARVHDIPHSSPFKLNGRSPKTVRTSKLRGIGRRRVRYTRADDLNALGVCLSEFLNVLTHHMTGDESAMFRAILFRLCTVPVPKPLKDDGLVWGTEREDESRQFRSAKVALAVLERAERPRKLEESVPELSTVIFPPPIRIAGGIQVPAPRRLRCILDLPVFQRLSWIDQLDSCSVVYPGACHSRFEHSLGTFFWCRTYLQRLVEFPSIRLMLDSNDIKAVLLSALLHDIGHYPLAHSIELITQVKTLKRHEEIGRHLLGADKDSSSEIKRDENLLRAIRSRNEWGSKPEYVAQIAWGRDPSSADMTFDARKLRLLRRIIDGPLDVDKIHYLLNDSIHTGNPVGTHFDARQLVSALCPLPSLDGIGISPKGIAAAESMALARYRMYLDVFWHHTTRARRVMIARAIDYIAREKMQSVGDEYQKYLEAALYHITDHEIMNWLWSESTGIPPAENLLKYLVEIIPGKTSNTLFPKRKLYKRLFDSNWLDVKLCEEISERLLGFTNRGRDIGIVGDDRLREVIERIIGTRQVIEEGDIILDIPTDQEKKANENRRFSFEKIQIVIPGGQEIGCLHDVSKVVGAAAQDFKEKASAVRVFIAPHLINYFPEARVKRSELLLSNL